MNGRETVLSAVRGALSGVPGSEDPDDAPVSSGPRADHAGPDVVGLFAEYRATVVRADRPLTLISGPSATSDIELDPVEGVHGPRTLA